MTKRNIQKHRVMKQISTDIWATFKNIQYKIRPGQHGRRWKFHDEKRVVRDSNKTRVFHSYGDYETVRRIKKFYKNMSDVQYRNVRKHIRKDRDYKKIPNQMSIIISLEQRLDTIVYRLGWSVSPMQARHRINHGWFKLNNMPIKSASQRVYTGDMITVNKDRKHIIQDDMVFKLSHKPVLNIPDYIEINQDISSAIIYRKIMDCDISYPVKVL